MMGRVVAALFLIPIALAAGYILLAAVKGKPQTLAMLFGPVRRAPVDFDTLELSPKPNQYLVCPPELCAAEPHAEAPVFEIPVEQLESAWMEMVQGLDGVRLLSSDPAVRQVDFEALTALIGFPDTVTVRFLPLTDGSSGGRSTAAIYSRSHYGHSDLGANKKRIDAWLERLKAHLADPRS